MKPLSNDTATDTASDDEARAWHDLHRAATGPYRQAGRYAWHFARGKLQRDSVFRGLLQHGLLPTSARVLDIGSGMSLLASLLQSCADLQVRGDWPSTWPVRASAVAYTGIELLPRDVARAQRSIGALPLQPRLLQADLRDAELPPCDLVVLLDVLHYVDHAAQQQLLQKVRAALRAGAAAPSAVSASASASAPESPGARLLLRVCDDRQQHRFQLTQWTDRLVMALRGRRLPKTWGRPLQAWIALLQELGFQVRLQPMQQASRFANHLLVCDLKSNQNQNRNPIPPLAGSGPP